MTRPASALIGYDEAFNRAMHLIRHREKAPPICACCAVSPFNEIDIVYIALGSNKRFLCPENGRLAGPESGHGCKNYRLGERVPPKPIGQPINQEDRS